MEPMEYIQLIPLDRVVEIHTSGPERQQDGTLMDAHCEMLEEDYILLDWAFAKTPVKLVTLEYIKDKNGLCNQIIELSRMLGRKKELRRSIA